MGVLSFHHHIVWPSTLSSSPPRVNSSGNGLPVSGDELL